MPDETSRPADPLLLLPLRLEYRVVSEGEQLRLASVSGTRRASTAVVSALGEKSPLRYAPVTAERREIWFRWLPDEPFGHEGVEAPTEEEQAALAAFLAVVQSTEAQWYDPSDPTVAAAWQTLAGSVGVYRAIHLVRTRAAAVDPELAEAAGLIVGLPGRVSVYGLAGGSVTLLGEGAPIPDGLRYAPAALGAGNWLTSFPEAVDAGMGIKIIDPDRVEVALDADWLVAVGLRDGDATAAIEAFLRDAIANGNFELLEQDTPTNNSEQTKTRYELVPRDPLAALRAATHAEQRAVTDPPSDADVLATALGVNTQVVVQATGAGYQGVRHARSMSTALLPGLVDIMFSWTSDVRLDRNELIDFLASHLTARGPLPAIRLDTHPFGVLPIVERGRIDAPEEMPESRRRVFDFVSSVGATAAHALAAVASQQPVILPGAADNPDRLKRILRLNAVGKRVDVVDAAAGPGSPARRMTCPLVEGPDHRPGDYLGLILARPLQDLPDPDETDLVTPLLFRLLRFALERTVARLPRSLHALPLVRLADEAPSADRPRLRAYVAALEQLAGLSRDQLETLLLEVVDVLDHRSDAWLTALATARLAVQRGERPAGLRVGYYGFLGRLRPESATGSSDGYIQVPNAEKAITAGLLRSAAHRHAQSGAFDVDLSSRRVRRALAMVDLMREGLSPREVLGHRAERWLHDQGEDLLIHLLRDRFPVAHAAGGTARQRRLVDGLAIAGSSDDDLGGLTASQVATTRRLRARLADDQDALSDLIVAEAVHQLAMGNTGAANAWISVLSGDPVPSQPAFVAAHRSGHGSTFRYSLVLDPASISGGQPREVIEPALSRIATRLLPGFSSCTVRVSVPLPTGDGPPFSLDVRLGADLGMRPIDLVVGGRNELVLRTRHHTIRRWQTDAAVRAELGALPAAELVSHVNQVQPISVDLDHGGPSAASLLERAQWISQLIQHGRMLEPADLNAPMPAAERLAEPQTLELLTGGITALVARTQEISDRLAALLAQLTGALDGVRLAAAELDRLTRAAAPVAEIETAREQLAQAREAIEGPLLTSSRFGLPEALLPFATEQLAPGGTANEHVRRFESIAARLADKRTAIDEAAATATTVPATQREAEQLRSRLASALQATCDRDGLPVLAPFDKQPATSPPLEPVTDIGADIAPLLPIRPKLRTVSWLMDTDQDQLAWRSATVAAEEPDDDPIRSEAERPPSQHIGTYIGRSGGILGDGADQRYCGLVIDEWSEFRPSMVQNTGMAINYDAPQSEPPHVLLLAVAARADQIDWTVESAARLVAEAIRLMQIRAAPSAQASRRNLWGTLFSQIGPAGSGRRRIPTASHRLVVATDVLADLVELSDGVPSQSNTVYSVVERRPTTDG